MYLGHGRRERTGRAWEDTVVRGRGAAGDGMRRQVSDAQCSGAGARTLGIAEQGSDAREASPRVCAEGRLGCSIARWGGELGRTRELAPAETYAETSTGARQDSVHSRKQFGRTRELAPPGT
ncbi:hypothetical protein B0H11DRAFT_1933096 [Mycena galericulata]|nr:hypothetical protein B0H11DRAFT_1933096 [Mycena galericulata]